MRGKLSGPVQRGIASLFAAAHLSSCVGFGTVSGGREERASFTVNRTSSKPMRAVSESASGANPSRKEMLRCWGPPDAKDATESGEVWSYDRGMAVRGVLPMIGVAIPLVVPVGKNSHQFYFPRSDSSAERMESEFNHIRGGYLGISNFSESQGFGFHSLGRR